MDFSRQENLLELEEGGILSYAMSKVQLQLFVSEIFFSIHNSNTLPEIFVRWPTSLRWHRHDQQELTSPGTKKVEHLYR